MSPEVAEVLKILQDVTVGATCAVHAANLCITTIEEAKNDDFLVCLLTSCGEWYHVERRRHLAPVALLAGASAPRCPRFVAFVTFLKELYSKFCIRLPTLHRPTKVPFGDPVQLTLCLLNNACHVCLRSSAVDSLVEMECLYSVLMTIGACMDSQPVVRASMPELWVALRDAQLTTSLPAVRKKLLELIELQAAGWHVPHTTHRYFQDPHRPGIHPPDQIPDPPLQASNTD